MAHDEIKITTTDGRIVTIAPAELAFRYLKQACDDGNYEIRPVQGGRWTLAVERKNGTVIPTKFQGDKKAFQAILPEFDPEAN